MAGGVGVLGRGRRWPSGAAVVAVAACLLAVGCTCSAGDGGVGLEPVGETVDLSAPGFHALPEAPIAERSTHHSHMVKVWTGDELIVWGGQWTGDPAEPGRLLGDGASLSLDDGRWAPLPPAPFPNGLFHPLGAWDGEEMIVIGSVCERTIPPVTDGSAPPCPDGPAAAAYDPATATWRRLDPPPIPVSDLDSDPVIRRGLAIGGAGAAQFVTGWPADVIGWDRDTETWTFLPSPLPDRVDSEVCADQAAEQFVLTLRADLDANERGWVRVLPLGADAWGDVVELDLALDPRFTCGDGYLATERADLFDVEGAGGYLIDAATGQSRPIDPPSDSPAFASPWIAGPWLFAKWLELPPDGSTDRGSYSTHEVRLVGQDRPLPLEAPDDFPGVRGEVQLPDIGLITETGNEQDGFGLLLWRAPPELVP